MNVARLECLARIGLPVCFGAVARDSFGMTEIGAGILMPAAAVHKLDKRICGVPAPFRETRIIGEDGRECAAGEVGEQQLRGRSSGSCDFSFPFRVRSGASRLASRSAKEPTRRKVPGSGEVLPAFDPSA